MIRKLDHLVITTADPQACLEFYQRLGFVPRQGNGRYELFAGDLKINVHVRGRELSPHAQNVQLGCNDLCFELEGPLEAFVDSLQGQGIALELGVVARTGVRGPMASVYLRDPDGNLLEFCSYSQEVQPCR